VTPTELQAGPHVNISQGGMLSDCDNNSNVADQNRRPSIGNATTEPESMETDMSNRACRSVGTETGELSNEPSKSTVPEEAQGVPDKATTTGVDTTWRERRGSLDCRSGRPKQVDC
jgi:hypothetical protein